MSASTPTTRRRFLCGFSLIALSTILLTNPLTHIVARGAAATPLLIAMRGFAAPIHMLLLIGSVFAIMQLLRSRADRMGLIGGALTMMGWAVGVRILGLGQLESLLASGVTGVPPDTLERMFAAAPLVRVSIIHLGLLFPIGLITLGATIIATRPIARPIGALLVIGAVLFPVGRIGHFGWAYIASDLFQGASFALIGWQILTRPELWSAEEAKTDDRSR